MASQNKTHQEVLASHSTFRLAVLPVVLLINLQTSPKPLSFADSPLLPICYRVPHSNLGPVGGPGWTDDSGARPALTTTIDPLVSWPAACQVLNKLILALGQRSFQESACQFQEKLELPATASITLKRGRDP